LPSAVEADRPAGYAVASELVRSLGGFEVALPAAATPEEAAATKARYHAAATMVATGVVALVDRAAAALGDPQAPESCAPFRRAYAALALSAARNVGADAGARGLTGALARGDEALVELHRAALRDCRDAAALYAAVEGAARQMLAADRTADQLRGKP